MTVALLELNEAVTLHDKPGTLTLTIKVTPATQGELGTVIVVDDVVVKAPKPTRQGAIYFVDEDYSLTRGNPRQLRIVEPGAKIEGEIDDPVESPE